MNLYKEYKEEKIEEQCKKRDQEFLSKDTVIIYEQTKTQDLIIRIVKIIFLLAIIMGIMFCTIYLFTNIK